MNADSLPAAGMDRGIISYGDCDPGPSWGIKLVGDTLECNVGSLSASYSSVSMFSKHDMLSFFLPRKSYIKNINFHPLEVVSRYLDPKFQMGETTSIILLNLRPKIFKYRCLNAHIIPNKSDSPSK